MSYTTTNYLDMREAQLLKFENDYDGRYCTSECGHQKDCYHAEIYAEKMMGINED